MSQISNYFNYKTLTYLPIFFQMALVDNPFLTQDFDETSFINEDDSGLSQKISSLACTQRRFLSDCDTNYPDISLRKLDFETLVKETPFSRTPSQIRLHSSTRITTEPSQTKITDISTCSSRRDDHSFSSGGNLLHFTKSVKFGDYTPTQAYTPGILKSGNRCRFPRREKDYQKELARHSEDSIPRWGRDWEALERKLTPHFPSETSQEDSHVCTEESEVPMAFPCKTKKRSGFFQSQSLKLKNLMQAWKTQRGKR